MDGVIVDLVGGLAKWHLFECDLMHWPKQEYSLTVGFKKMGFLGKNLLQPLQFVEFYRNLPPSQHWEEIIQILEQRFDRANIVLLSDPKNAAAAEGKRQWIQHWLPDFAIRQAFRFAENKSSFANPHTVLVDDFQLHVDAFKESGGRSILFPQPWNRNFRDFESPYCIEFFKRSVDALLMK